MTALTKHLAAACDAIDMAYHSEPRKTSFLRSRQRRAPSIGPWVEYERAKQSWLDKNPSCTPAEYEAAMRRISQECGV